ncbi:MAG: aminotransferase class I/II-fold pyridoxal phosphate-dependent enzyme [Planctomycetes bacterium]|nr:aminotransferase class I/II-fold pyridoxal phosphate-dependent enzyme [Planctomycetota bacterium]
MHETSDLRSDTVTKPTEKMKRAGMTAELGDDVMRDDKTTILLEKTAAEITGKEDALFVTSGTQGNLLALSVHSEPGSEIIMDEQSHTFVHEQGGVARIALCQPVTLPMKRGMMDLDRVREKVRAEDIHHPRTSVIECENTHNRAGGVPLEMEYLKGLRRIADECGAKVHMDGARIFNASVATGIAVKEYAAEADSVMFCLSKGLCCPIGSILAGPAEFVAKARRMRKVLGGGMRQVGFIAAAGIVALEEMVERLAEDHRRARVLGEAVAGMPGLSVDLESVRTNMVYFSVEKGPASELVERLAAEKVLCFAEGDNRQIRMVCHKDVDDDDIDRAVEALKKAV